MKKIVKKKTGGNVDSRLQKKRDKNMARVKKNESKGSQALKKGNTKKASRKFDKADKLDERRVKFTQRKMKTGGSTTKKVTNKRSAPKLKKRK